jgi:hypothetical protein
VGAGNVSAVRTPRAVSPSIHPAFAQVAPVRRCARPDCSATAAVTLVCDYAARTVVMVAAADAPEVDDPARYDLCARHADRFRPPQGWELTVDVRDTTRSGAGPDSDPQPAAAPCNDTSRDISGRVDLYDVDPRELAAALG